MNEFQYPPPLDPTQQMSLQLRAELYDLFAVEETAIRPGKQPIAFIGRFLGDSERGYKEISRRFAAYGYTPTAHVENGRHILVALPGLIPQAKRDNPLINLLMFVATVFTTLAAWSAMSNGGLYEAILEGDMARAQAAFIAAAPFTMTLLGILGVHELGHYLAARYHQVDASLPYFIPLPFIGLGTLGAFISIKSPMQNRKVLFDVGVSGPLAGFVVALPLLLAGLYWSSAVPFFASGLTLQRLGTSLLVDGLVNLFHDLPATQTLSLHPVFFAAWLGLLLTGMNLLPAGQLDGGHVSYALFGRYAHWLAVATFLGLIAAGYYLSFMWYVWAFFVLISGLRHAPTLNDVTRPDSLRQLIGLAALALFILTIVPIPFG
jgi:membrane-associated protease RseP (regulator of RpoE activity)